MALRQFLSGFVVIILVLSEGKTVSLPNILLIVWVIIERGNKYKNITDHHLS